jgi:hypothetical protein
VSGDTVWLDIKDAVATVGGMCMEFALQPEIWPVFYAWMCTTYPESFAPEHSELIRADIARVYGLLPSKIRSRT